MCGFRVRCAAIALLAMVAGNRDVLYAQASTLRATDLDGLRLRNIGPVNMSSRVVDMDVVESDSFVMYVASARGWGRTRFVGRPKGRPLRTDRVSYVAAAL